MVVQCLRCMYKIEIGGRDGPGGASSSAAAAVSSCVDHGAPERKPQDLQVRGQGLEERDESAARRGETRPRLLCSLVRPALSRD